MPEPLLKLLVQLPMVAVLLFVWWTSRKDSLNEIRRLQDRLSEKDAQLREFTSGFDKVAFALERIKDRLK